jgi:hypothetical protein
MVGERPVLASEIRSAARAEREMGGGDWNEWAVLTRKNQEAFTCMPL